MWVMGRWVGARGGARLGYPVRGEHILPAGQSVAPGGWYGMLDLSVLRYLQNNRKNQNSLLHINPIIAVVYLGTIPGRHGRMMTPNSTRS